MLWCFDYRYAVYHRFSNLGVFISNTRTAIKNKSTVFSIIRYLALTYSRNSPSRVRLAAISRFSMRSLRSYNIRGNDSIVIGYKQL